MTYLERKKYREDLEKFWERQEQLRQEKFKIEGEDLDFNLKLINNFYYDYINEYKDDENLQKYLLTLRYRETVDGRCEDFSNYHRKINRILENLEEESKICLGFKFILSELDEITTAYQDHNDGIITNYSSVNGVSAMMDSLIRAFHSGIRENRVYDQILYLLKVAMKQEPFMISRQDNQKIGEYNRMSVLDYIKNYYNGDVYNYLIKNKYLSKKNEKVLKIK